MNIEELNLDDFDISEIEIDEALEENFKNIIYSQPFSVKMTLTMNLESHLIKTI